MPCEGQKALSLISRNMTATLNDPEGKCDKATMQLQDCLLDEGKRLAIAGEYANALVTMFRAYALRPGVTPVLHGIAEIYDAMEDPKAATACRRGVIPETAEKLYFNSQLTRKRIIAASRASNSRHIKTNRPESIKLHTPASNGQPNTLPEFRAVKTESRGSFVSVLKNAGVWFDGFNTTIIDSEQYILREHIKGNTHLVADVARQRPEAKLQGTSCFLDARSSFIYYHWMMDVLPKFSVLKAAGIELNDIDHFIVRCQSSFQKQTLQHLGIPVDRIVSPGNHNVTRCQNLIVPYLKHDRGDRFYNGLGLGMAQWVPDWLKRTFLSHTPQQKEKIYISRTCRGTRSLAHEKHLVEELSLRGFRCITLETLSVTAQAELLASAKFVIAPHGAGLTNLAFCQPGTTVIEIFGEYVVPCYWALSQLSALDYHAYFVKSDQQESAHTKINQLPDSLADRRNKNIEINIVDFVAYLDNATIPQRQAS